MPAHPVLLHHYVPPRHPLGLGDDLDLTWREAVGSTEARRRWIIRATDTARAICIPLHAVKKVFFEVEVLIKISLRAHQIRKKAQ